MRTSFTIARAEILAKREGITFQEACSRLGKAGARRRRELARQNACTNVPPAIPAPKRRLWWEQGD